MNKNNYFRPLVQVGPAQPSDAVSVAGGWGWCTHAEVLSYRAEPMVVTIREVPDDVLERISAPRAPIAGLSFETPRVMGILNVTPDSFSDGGQHTIVEDAVRAAQAMARAGVDLIDVGGESTRPGARTVPADEEIARVLPAIEGMKTAQIDTPVSVDTRKAAVAQAATAAGAALVNDVSGFTYDPALSELCVTRNLPVCVMHGPVDPSVMQKDPQYDNVALEVYDFLDERISQLETLGIPRNQIIADPGIGFGKTLAHNLALLARLSLFHSLGVPILLGASRKRFIGTIGDAEEAQARMPGSLGVALAALNHGIQLHRVHDVAQTIQAFALWRAATEGEQS